MYTPNSFSRVLPYTGAAVPVWQVAGLGFAFVVMGILLILSSRKSQNPLIRKLLLVIVATALAFSTMVLFNLYGLGVVMLYLAIIFTAGLWASAGNLLPRLAFEPHMKGDGDYVWCFTKNGVPVSSKNH